MPDDKSANMVTEVNSEGTTVPVIEYESLMRFRSISIVNAVMIVIN